MATARVVEDYLSSTRRCYLPRQPANGIAPWPSDLPKEASAMAYFTAPANTAVNFATALSNLGALTNIATIYSQQNAAGFLPVNTASTAVFMLS